MNILELDSYNLADAVKFNDQLNPRIWSGTKMRPEVREKLLEIAADFKEFLGLGDIDVKDITVSGSNAAYTYTPQSDIDLHLVVDIPQADADEVYRELFDAKKYQYNDLHNIKIGGYDVELYVENANKPPVSKGVFSVLNNDWISIPRQRKATVDDDSVRSKYEDIKHRIEDAVKSGDTDRIDALARKIKAYRQAGLDAHGELGSENLAYKMLRNQGYIKKLYDARAAARDAELSLAEQNREKKPFVYGFKTESVPQPGQSSGAPTQFAPGTKIQTRPMTAKQIISSVPGVPYYNNVVDDWDAKDYSWGVTKKVIEYAEYLKQHPESLAKLPPIQVVNGQFKDGAHRVSAIWLLQQRMDPQNPLWKNAKLNVQFANQGIAEDATLTPDGVNPTTCMFLNEKETPSHTEIIFDFMKFAVGELGLENVPSLKIKKDPQWSVVNKSFGRYRNDLEQIELAVGNRHIMDVLRTLAHELQHRKQDEREKMPPDAGKTGSPYENEAHVVAGILMRQYADLHPEYFEDVPVAESASGYIPRNKKEARDPRYAMALTVDIKPGETGKQANKMALKTDRQGRPGLLMKTANLREARESATVTRIDSKPITDFASGLKAYKHTDDWSQSGVDTGDDSYWKNKNLKTNTSRGLFAGDPHRTALYATGNAHETRYVEFTQNGQPIVYFDRKDLPAMRSRKTYLTVFDASNFKKLPTGEWFSENPGKPIGQVPIGDPFKYIASQGWIVRVTDDLNKVFKQVQKMHQAGKIAQYGAEGMSESKQDVAEAREGAMREIIRKALPGWPDYVIKDWVSSRIKNQEDLKNLTGWLGELNKMVQPNSWKLHQKMFLTFDMLSPKTRYFMKTKRQFGARNPFLIPRDEERSANAEQLIQARGMENLPPIIMLQHADGLELMEGWHRTMAAFRLHPEGFYVNAWIGQAIEKSVAEGKSHGYNATPLSQVPGEQEDDLGNQEATGPEFPPQMPPGTTKIDVSDLTDWYRLGQDISDLDDADPADYGKGPPQTVVVFPSDEAEQGYLKQFKRLGLKTHDMDPDVEGGEDIYGKHLRNKLSQELREFKEQDLFEIKMSPSNLRAEAAKTGAQAGMEFEMIVPNVEADSEPNYEIDMDQDTRSRSFSDIRDFFYDGDYNSRRDVDRLEEAMREQYEEWLYEQLDEAWNNDGEEYLKEYIEVNEEFDEEEANQEATNQLQAEYGDDISPEDFQKMLDALVKEKFDEFVQEAWTDQGRLYDLAREQFMEEQRDEYDNEREWLDDNYTYMSDISNNFDIAWPYYYDANQGGDAEADIERVADDFSEAVGMRVNWSGSYHGGRREPDAYVVEPDGSLDPDNSGDSGLEFVSPPMPIDKMIDQLNKVKAWAGDYGCYTNKSTGLHINISVPNYDLAKLDYVKLALLLGDKYILDQYGRSSNTYAKSALGKVQDLIKRDPSKGKELLDKMRGHMEDLATKVIHSGSTDKFTSINTKSGYIEFRSPGGDWLDANFDKIENTLLRFTVALSAAMDPEAYREEYLKKLYKLLEPVAQETKNKDTIKFFSDYVAGKMPKAALRSFIKQAQLERKVKRGQTDGKTDFWWDVWRDGDVPNGPGVQVVAKTREEALIKAAKEFGLASPEYMPAATATPVRPYDTSAVKASVGEPQAVGQRSGPSLNGRPSNPLGGWVISPENDRQTVVYRFNAAGFDDANVVRRQWAADNPGVWIVQRDENRTLGQPSAAQTQQQGNWGVWITSSGRFARMPGQTDNSVLRRFNSREEAQQFLANTPGVRSDIEIREIEPTQSAAGGPREYEIFADTDPFTVVRSFYAADDQAAQAILDQYRQDHPGTYYRAHRAPVPGSTLDLQRQRAAAAQQAGGIINTANEPATGSAVGQVYNPSGRGEFTGQWLVLDPNNQVIYRFGGIGNSQSDANRLAMDWLRQNPRHMQAGVEVVPEMA